MFREVFGESYCGTPITYHIQGDKKWTGGALEGIKSSEEVFVFYADTIFEDRDISKLIDYDGYGCLVREVESPEKYGIFHQKDNGDAIEVIEKPENYIGNLANLWVYKFGPEILDLIDDLQPSPRGEYELTDAINTYCSQTSFRLFPIAWKFFDISYVEDIQTSEDILQESSKSILKNIPPFGTSLKLGNLKNFQIYLWINHTHVSELIEYSQDSSDTAIQKNTGDKKRFTHREKIQKWYEAPGRYFFSLVSSEWKLAGIWWGRPCTAPKIQEIQDPMAHKTLQDNASNLHTNAIRIYPDFRGQRIATPFVHTCMIYYRDTFPKSVMCIDTSTTNIPLQKSYQRAGYQKVGLGESEKSVESIENRLVYIQ